MSLLSTSFCFGSVDGTNTTLSFYALVRNWIEDIKMSDFPMADFAEAISRDLQCQYMLLRQITRLENRLRHGGPRNRKQKLTIYTQDLRPRLLQDLERTEKMRVAAEARVGAFDLSLQPYISASHAEEATAMLVQAEDNLHQLLSHIDALKVQRKEEIDRVSVTFMSEERIPSPANLLTTSFATASLFCRDQPHGIKARQILIPKPRKSSIVVENVPVCSSRIVSYDMSENTPPPTRERSDSAVHF